MSSLDVFSYIFKHYGSQNCTFQQRYAVISLSVFHLLFRWGYWRDGWWFEWRENLVCRSSSNRSEHKSTQDSLHQLGKLFRKFLKRPVMTCFENHSPFPQISEMCLVIKCCRLTSSKAESPIRVTVITSVRFWSKSYHVLVYPFVLFEWILYVLSIWYDRSIQFIF